MQIDVETIRMTLCLLQLHCVTMLEHIQERDISKDFLTIEVIAKKRIMVSVCRSEDQLASIFTKNLTSLQKHCMLSVLLEVWIERRGPTNTSNLFCYCV